MCTALTYQPHDFYFGRTLDDDMTYPCKVVVTPRNFALPFRHKEALERHYAMIGMAVTAEGYPLYFDAVNEKGVGMACLKFPERAAYGAVEPGRDNIAQFEFIPWVLGQCATVGQARVLLEGIHLTDTPFSREVPISQLHWMIADREEAIVVEATAAGLRLYDDPVGVLTNSPGFEAQMEHLAQFMHLSPKQTENRLAPQVLLEPYSRGMGAIGLPGDLSSPSRFVRAAFARCNAVSDGTEEACVSQFFHMLDLVQQPRGCCETGEGRYEVTLYTACCNASRGIYYYTTYENRQVTAVDLHRCDLEGKALGEYPLVKTLGVCWQN